MEIKEQQISYAFFYGCRVDFKYRNEDKTRTLYTIADLKCNEYGEILIGGCTSSTGKYKNFFMEEMYDINIYRHVDIAEL